MLYPHSTTNNIHEDWGESLTSVSNAVVACANFINQLRIARNSSPCHQLIMNLTRRGLYELQPYTGFICMTSKPPQLLFSFLLNFFPDLSLIEKLLLCTCRHVKQKGFSTFFWLVKLWTTFKYLLISFKSSLGPFRVSRLIQLKKNLGSSSSADFYVQGVVKNHFENWFGTEEKNLVIHLTFAKQHQLL